MRIVGRRFLRNIPPPVQPALLSRGRVLPLSADGWEDGSADSTYTWDRRAAPLNLGRETLTYVKCGAHLLRTSALPVTVAESRAVTPAARALRNRGGVLELELRSCVILIESRWLSIFERGVY